MRPTSRALLLLAAAAAVAAVPAHAQERTGAEIDPCTGKPVAVPVDSLRTPAAAADPGPPGTPRADAPQAPSAAQPASPDAALAPEAPAAPQQPVAPGPVAAGAPAACPPAGAADPAMARRTRQALRLGSAGLRREVRLGPAASVSVPTALGVDAGELFVGVSYQGRTRYTREDDGAVVAGFGVGTRRVLAVEVALTSYSTLRGPPLETGGVSVKLHRALARSTSVAVGWENALLWGDSDDDGSLYATATRLVPLRPDPSQRFGMAVFTLGVGNGRFRFESDDAAGNETVNLFAAAGVRVSEPLSLVADWTGQDVHLAASLVPIPRVPLVVTAGVADLTGNAGDGARFILSLGYGLSFRQPF